MKVLQYKELIEMLCPCYIPLSLPSFGQPGRKVGKPDSFDTRAPFLMNTSMSFSPDRKKSKKRIPLYLHVSHMLRRIRYSWIPFSELDPPITLRSLANALIACSALLLFQGISL